MALINDINIFYHNFNSVLDELLDCVYKMRAVPQKSKCRKSIKNKIRARLGIEPDYIVPTERTYPIHRKFIKSCDGKILYDATDNEYSYDDFRKECNC